MTLDCIDRTLWIAGSSMEAVVLGLVLWRRIYKTLPVFSCFLVWCLLSEVSMAAVMRMIPNTYLPAMLVNMTVDTMFELAILAELGKVVMRYNHVAPLSKAVIVLFTMLAFVLAGSLDKWNIPTQLPIAQMLYVILMQLIAVLRVVFLLTLVWWSSLQGLNWPTRELRILTGLAFYMVSTLCVAILHSHNMGGMEYHRLDQLLVGGYLWTLSYWILASTTKVVKHQ